MTSLAPPSPGLILPYAATVPAATSPPPAPVANVARLVRIQASTHWLLEELHALRGSIDLKTHYRLAEMDRALTEQLDEILDMSLRSELHHLVDHPPIDDSSQDEIRIALAQLEGWIGGLLGGLAMSGPNTADHSPT